MAGIDDIVTIEAIRDEAEYATPETAAIINAATDDEIRTAIDMTHRGHEEQYFALHDSMQNDAVAFLVDNATQ